MSTLSLKSICSANITQRGEIAGQHWSDLFQLLVWLNFYYIFTQTSTGHNKPPCRTSWSPDKDKRAAGFDDIPVDFIRMSTWPMHNLIHLLLFELACYDFTASQFKALISCAKWVGNIYPPLTGFQAAHVRCLQLRQVFLWWAKSRGQIKDRFSTVHVTA